MGLISARGGVVLTFVFIYTRGGGGGVGETQVELFEFKTNLVYILSSRTVRAP